MSKPLFEPYQGSSAIKGNRTWVNPKEYLRVVDSSYGGCTGINDYILSNGEVITCRPDELENLLKTLISSL